MKLMVTLSVLLLFTGTLMAQKTAHRKVAASAPVVLKHKGKTRHKAKKKMDEKERLRHHHPHHHLYGGEHHHRR